MIQKLSYKKLKNLQVQRPGDSSQQDVEIEDKTYARYNWSVKNN